MTSKYQNSHYYGGYTFNFLGQGPSRYIARHCNEIVPLVSLSLVYATSAESRATVTETDINQPYAPPTTMEEGNDYTSGVGLEDQSMAQGIPYFVSGQARAHTISEPLNSSSIACNSLPNHMSQPLRRSFITSPPEPWTRKTQQNMNTLFHPDAHTPDMDREIENLGHELATASTHSPLWVSQPHKQRHIPHSTRCLAPNLPSLESMTGQFCSRAPTKCQYKHQCRLCRNSFKRPSSLQIHMRSHTGEKPFACGFGNCKKRFSVVANLRRHEKIHSRRNT